MEPDRDYAEQGVSLMGPELGGNQDQFSFHDSPVQRKGGIPSIELVLENDCCVGCGACAVRGQMVMTRDAQGCRKAHPAAGADREALAEASKICPFADESPNEDVHSDRLYGSLSQADDVLGRYESVFHARIADDEEVAKSSSGGMTTFVLRELERLGAIDYVIHVGAGSSELFDYRASPADGASEFRKSVYYSSSFEEAVRVAKSKEGRYAFVGVPCFVSALRNLMLVDKVIEARVAYVFALICGHMKSSLFAESLAWQVGVKPNKLKAVDFRVKKPGTAASDYGFVASSSNGQGTAFRRSGELFGTNWGHGTFQLNACNFCDDIFGESADATFGDAWLPEFDTIWQGTNIVVSRSGVVTKLIEQAIDNNRVIGGELTVQQARTTQQGNINHRRFGLMARLAHDEMARKWVPIKRSRVLLAYRPDSRRAAISQKRRNLSAKSFRAFETAKRWRIYSLYPILLSPALIDYEHSYVEAKDFGAGLVPRGKIIVRVARAILRGIKIDASSVKDALRLRTKV
ncbi:Coenzyme F420 hydrogenase/dehydrogenase, beta subunit C-terminal domain [Rhodococcoides corynebacterioides]|uniref:Coenzyme F420 hydrogenase/dehydrogenase, beta subunit C-terminal domain n=1 Tax=Rhodococcoides corynebacterioides TaxID=53972 RepID=UPI001C9B3AA0|nr:Coenzyme F420 hydrogenase/dehydrogenase, beta subunit C-terminal domain [Rhodococcus corynebacterioides]MBY6361520.1 Coenzyme F420 hydrogenase/dehydrogenase, beta subunit C-terminal domain [Rhodococcus corynebacterioides]